MIERSWHGIAAYCTMENKVSLGLVEGLNNKIKVLQRRAYGYRDEESSRRFCLRYPETRPEAHCDPRRPTYVERTAARHPGIALCAT